MFFILFLLLLSHSLFINAEWPYIPFDDAMKKSEFNDTVYNATTQIVGIDGIVLYNFFKDSYENN